MQSKASSHMGLTALALAVGVFAGTALAALVTEVEPLTAAESGQVSGLDDDREGQSPKEGNQRLRFINDKAQEFGMSPHIVAIVDRYARRHVDATKPEWRLIQTPEFMTHLMLSIIYAESKGRPDAVGDGGNARGLTQIWTSTARQYEDVDGAGLLDPEVNVRLSFRHFEYLLKRYRGNVAMALYSWNRGQGTVDRLLRYGQSPNNGYGRRVYRASLAAATPGAAAGD